MAATILQQVENFRDSLVEKQDLAAWVEDRYEDVVNGERMSHLLMTEIESVLDPNRARSSDKDSVDLTVRHDTIDRTAWLAGHVWCAFKDLEERISARINLIVDAENATLKAKTRQPPVAAAAPMTTTFSNKQALDLIDGLQNALDRIEIMFTLLDAVPQQAEVSNIFRVLGDVHDLVCKAHNVLYDEHKKGRVD